MKSNRLLLKLLVNRFLLFWLFTACVSDSYAQADWNNSSFVHRNNQQILDGQNNAINLNGVNLGGWLMWEGWIWGGGYTAEKTINSTMEDIIGTAETNAFRDSVYHNFITKKDIQKISEECFNVVRIPFNHKLLEDDFTPYVYKPEGWAILDSVLSWCEEYNVYAIIDLHSAPGGQSNSFTADPDFAITLWNGSINQNRTRRLWKAIADRYKNRGIVAGYDLLNEPNVSSDSTMLQVYQDIIDSIRSVDNNHMLFIEGNSFATDFSMFNTLPDPNICFQFHFYTWFFSNAIPSHLQEFTDVSDALNVPIWCGEWGEDNLNQLQTNLDYFNDPGYKVRGTTFWTWKKMKFTGSSAPFYNGIDTTLLWNKTIKWISNTNQPEPTVLEMQAGITEFIQNMKLYNCEFNPALSDILNACGPASVNALVEDQIVVSPNPFSDKISVTNPFPSADYNLTNASGQVVWSGKELEEQDFSSLRTGVYVLSITTNELEYRIKIIKH